MSFMDEIASTKIVLQNLENIRIMLSSGDLVVYGNIIITNVMYLVD